MQILCQDKEGNEQICQAEGMDCGYTYPDARALEKHTLTHTGPQEVNPYCWSVRDSLPHLTEVMALSFLKKIFTSIFQFERPHWYEERKSKEWGEMWRSGTMGPDLLQTEPCCLCDWWTAKLFLQIPLYTLQQHLYISSATAGSDTIFKKPYIGGSLTVLSSFKRWVCCKPVNKRVSALLLLYI